jgi:hypothetical protein
MMLRLFARKYSTRDIVEEYRSIPVYPLLDEWEVADNAWAVDIGGIPYPDWTKFLSFTLAGEFLRPSFTFLGFLAALLALCLMLVTYVLIHLFAVLKKRKVEEHGDFILSPVSPMEYKDTMAELNGSRTNRVFEFFKVTAPSVWASLSIARRQRGKPSHSLLSALTRRKLPHLRTPAACLRRGLRRKFLLLLWPQPLPRGRPKRSASPPEELSPSSQEDTVRQSGHWCCDDGHHRCFPLLRGTLGQRRCGHQQLVACALEPKGKRQ